MRSQEEEIVGIVQLLSLDKAIQVIADSPLLCAASAPTYKGNRVQLRVFDLSCGLSCNRDQF